MPLSFDCPNCGSKVVEPDKAMGELTICPQCQHETSIPNDPKNVTFTPHPSSENSDAQESLQRNPAERSFVVKTLLILNFLLPVAIACLLFYQMIVSDPLEMIAYAIGFLFQLAGIVFLLAIWFRRKWGWIGLTVWAVLTLFLYLAIMPIAEFLKMALWMIIPLILFYGIFQSERDYLK